MDKYELTTIKKNIDKQHRLSLNSTMTAISSEEPNWGEESATRKKNSTQRELEKNYIEYSRHRSPEYFLKENPTKRNGRGKSILKSSSSTSV